MQNTKAVRTALAALCLQRLREGPTNDTVAASIATAMLETLGPKVRGNPEARKAPRVLQARSLLALRLLSKIGQIQREILVGHHPLSYPKTKAVLWAEVCYGCFWFEKPSLVAFLARALLATKCATRHTKETDESAFLDEVLRDVIIGCSFDRMKVILAHVTQGSNWTVVHNLSHRLMGMASPADIRKFAQT